MPDDSPQPKMETVPIPAGLPAEIARVMFESMKETCPAVVPEVVLPSTFETMGEGMQQSFEHAARQTIAVVVGRLRNEGWMIRRPTN